MRIERSGGQTSGTPTATLTVQLHLRGDYSKDAIAHGEYSGSHVGGLQLVLDIADESPLTAAAVLEETVRHLVGHVRSEAAAEARGD